MNGSAADEAAMPVLYMKATGFVFILAGELFMVNDFNHLGVTYFAPGRLQSSKGRKLKWFFVGCFANFLSMLFSEIAIVLLYLQTDKVIDFVLNFSALFVLYQV